MCELSHEVLNDLRLSILGNEEFSAKSQNQIRLSLVPTLCSKKKLAIAPEK